MNKDMKENNKLIKAKRKAQKRLFKKRLLALFQTEYRYSLKFEDAHVFDDGKAYINVDLTKCESPFSIYSYENRLNTEIYDYINQETFFLPPDIPVVINFDDDGKYDEDLKLKIKKTVIRHYSLEYEDKRYELHKQRLFSLVTLIIGVIFLSTFLALSLAVENSNNVSKVFSEIVYILSWVFIWESVDRFALSGFDQTVDVRNAGQLALLEIQFGKPMIKK